MEKSNQIGMNVIALIIPEITMFFFPSVIEGIAEITRKNGFHLMVLQSHDSLVIEKENIQICCDQHVDGILLSLTSNTVDLNHLELPKSLGIPVVLFDKTLSNADFDEVVINDEDVSAACVDHLYAIGCRKIVGLFGDPNLVICQKRMAGFKSRMNHYGLAVTSFNAIYSVEHMLTTEEMEDAMRVFQPDGVFAMSDELIAAAVPAMRKAGLEIPFNCHLIGISDGKLPHFMDSNIAFMHHDGLEVGKMATGLLVERITNPHVSKAKKLVVLNLPLVGRL